MGHLCKNVIFLRVFRCKVFWFKQAALLERKLHGVWPQWPNKFIDVNLFTKGCNSFYDILRYICCDGEIGLNRRRRTTCCYCPDRNKSQHIGVQRTANWPNQTNPQLPYHTFAIEKVCVASTSSEGSFFNFLAPWTPLAPSASLPAHPPNHPKGHKTPNVAQFNQI